MFPNLITIFSTITLCHRFVSTVSGQDVMPSGAGSTCDRALQLPGVCDCTATTLRCLFAELTAIPRNSSDGITLLDLRYNKLKIIVPDAFKQYTILDTLILSNNLLTTLNDDVFHKLHKLRHLWLNSNGLRIVRPHAFRGLKNLMSIHLESNRIPALHHATFAPLHKLTKIYLHQNDIKKVPRDLFVRNSKLERIRIDENPLHCDCETLWLTDILKNMSSPVTATCTTPVQFSGQSILMLTAEMFNCEMPRIVREPNDVEANHGDTVRLECTASGSPNPIIHWMHNDQEIHPHQEHHHHELLGGGRLKVEFMDESVEGIYQCMAKSPVGDAMGRKVQVRNRRQVPPSRLLSRPRPSSAIQESSRPEFTQPPTDFDVRDGESIEIPCETIGSPSPAVTWKRDGQVLLPNSTTYRISSSNSLHIDNPDQRHNGAYECVAQNIHGTIRAYARVRVRVRPVIIEAPQNSHAYIGGRMVLRCRADGFPAPYLAWTINGNPTPTTFVHDISRDGTELSFTNVAREDQGTYKCVAQNSAGTASASATLTVYDDVSQVPEANPSPSRSVVPSIFSNSGQSISLTVPLSQFPGLDQRVHGPRDKLTPAQIQAVVAARAGFEDTMRMVEEKVKRGMIWSNLASFDYNETLPFEQVQLVAELSGCRSHRKVVKDCSGCYHKKYRTFDGTCNNLQKPMQGASYTALRRILKPEYEDGLGLPIGCRQDFLWPIAQNGEGSKKDKLYNGFPKPSARLVSTRLLKTPKITPDTRHSHMLMQWGQFLDHDLSFTLMEAGHEIFPGHANCKSSCTTEPPCFPIEIPPNDPRLPHEQCMEFIRSRPVCGSGVTSILFGPLTPREQINTLTSYIDGSMIYGSSAEVATFIRDHNSRGLFRTSLPAPGTEMPLLPYNDPQTAPEEVDCKRVRQDERNFPCFTAGEIRVNEQLGLLAMHTAWFREHNRIAERLGELNPQWSGERIFQEARKIVGAEIQHITYTGWLPKILGPTGMQLLGKYEGYQPNASASVANSFATATLRMGHSTIFPILRRLNSSFETIPEGDLSLHQAFFAPHRIFDHGGIDPILRGLFASPAKLLQKAELMNTELTEKLFGTSTRAHRIPLDLGAMNIQRGRDHGLPSYVEFRRYCNLAVPTTFAQLKNEVEPEQLRKLEEVYKVPGSIDLFAGSMSERPLPGARIGTTFMCLLAEQFRNTRNGDRFWYEKSGVFTSEQLDEIKKSSLAKIMCDNTDTIDKVQKDIFLLAGQQGGYSWCEDVPGMDLTPWAECCEDCYLTQGNRQENTLSAPGFAGRSRREKSAISDKKRKIETLENRVVELETILEEYRLKSGVAALLTESHSNEAVN